MDDSQVVVRLNALFPEIIDEEREFAVTLTAPRPDDGEPLVPAVLPKGVLGCWSAESVIVSVNVMASRASGAVAAVEALLPDLARAAGASFEVRAP